MAYELGPDGFIRRLRPTSRGNTPAPYVQHGHRSIAQISIGSVLGSGILGSLILGMGGCLVLFVSRMGSQAGRDSILPFAGAYDNPFWLIGFVVGALSRLAAYMSGAARALLIILAIASAIVYAVVQSSQNQTVQGGIPISSAAPVATTIAPNSTPSIARRRKGVAKRVQAVMPRSAIRPSFDCNRAATASEKLICSDASLANLDVQMVSAFRAALSHLSRNEETQLRQEHLQWFKTYARTCNALGNDQAQLRSCIHRFLS